MKDLNISNRKRYKVDEVILNTNYSIPKFLFENELKILSNDARVLYALLKDKHEISIKNNQINKNNEVYLEYTREDMYKMLGISKPTVIKAVNELKKYHLLEEERIGNRQANRIYLNE